MKNIILSLLVIVLIGFAGYKAFSPKWSVSKEVEVATTTPVVATEQVEKDVFVIDISTSTITWKGAFVAGKKSETGTIMLKSGKGKFENATISTGEFVMDMTSIKDAGGSAQLETHLKSDDFFNVEKFPEAKFELLSFTPAKTAGEFVAKGKLTIRDVTKDFTFPVKLSVEGQNMLRVTGNITFNRADYNVKYGSSSFFKGLGDKVISDKVELTLNLVTKPIEISQPPSSSQQQPTN
jgi:polyisoprenoid-binding protein YceI